MNCNDSQVSYEFDYAYDDRVEAPNAEAGFRHIMGGFGRSIVEDIESGRDVLYMAFGQNSGGKSYSVFGREETDGLLVRIMELLISRGRI